MGAGRRFKLCQASPRVHYVRMVHAMWLLDEDLSFAKVHYVQIVDTMWMMDADLNFARYHYVQIVIVRVRGPERRYGPFGDRIVVVVVFVVVLGFLLRSTNHNKEAPAATTDL